MRTVYTISLNRDIYPRTLVRETAKGYVLKFRENGPEVRLLKRTCPIYDTWEAARQALIEHHRTQSHTFALRSASAAREVDRLQKLSPPTTEA